MLDFNHGVNINTKFNGPDHWVVLNEGEGPFISFETCASLPMPKALVPINPVQSFNGYDRPWPAGYNKNKLKITATSTTKNDVTMTVNSDGTVTLSGTSSSAGNTDFVLASVSFTNSMLLTGCPSGGGSTTYRLAAQGGNFDDGNGVTLSANYTGSIYIRVAAGANVDGKVFQPMARLFSIADGSFVPYANTCPITGFTGADLWRTGENLLPNKKTQDTNNRVSIGDENKLTDANYYNIFLKTGSYMFSFKRLNGKAYGLYYRQKTVDTNTTILTMSSTATSVAFTVAADDWYHFWIYNSGGVSPDDIYDMQLELGSTASAYKPYTGVIIPVSWQDEAGTVYSGTYDFASGILISDKATMTFDGTENWSISTNTSLDIPDMKSGNNMDGLCSCLETGTTHGKIRFGHSDAKIYIVQGKTDYGLTDVATAQAFMAGQQIVYPLADPIVYQLSPTQIMTLVGDNNVWSDISDLEAEWYECVDTCPTEPIWMSNPIECPAFTDTIPSLWHKRKEPVNMHINKC